MILSLIAFFFMSLWVSLLALFQLRGTPSRVRTASRARTPTRVQTASRARTPAPTPPLASKPRLKRGYTLTHAVQDLWKELWKDSA